MHVLTQLLLGFNVFGICDMLKSILAGDIWCIKQGHVYISLLGLVQLYDSKRKSTLL